MSSELGNRPTVPTCTSIGATSHQQFGQSRLQLTRIDPSLFPQCSQAELLSADRDVGLRETKLGQRLGSLLRVQALWWPRRRLAIPTGLSKLDTSRAPRGTWSDY
jgi:hypothetical protein